jgi:Zn-dependent peptidase ImmA (M78 family)
MMFLTQERLDALEDKAITELVDSPDVVLPFDITKFVISKGFKVESRSFGDENITGMVMVNEHENIRDSGTNKLIVLNDNLSYQRARFITAHEYAHYALHKREDQPLFACRDDRTRNKSVEELEAEALARCLLMPKPFVESAVRLLEQKSNGSLRRSELPPMIAFLFDVTVDKSTIRLEELRMIPAEVA